MMLSPGQQPPEEIPPIGPGSMTQHAIDAVIEAFAQGARDAQKLGFDGVELHGAHGYLIDQFFWEATNPRTDQYGGDLVSCTRFVEPGLCGIVDGSVLPGYFGLEAGQSAVGDIFNWWVNYIQPHGEKLSHQALDAEAMKLQPGESGLLALDWNNGNRTILVDQKLTGLLVGQTLYTTPAEIYRALVEATAFGALTIINRFEEYGVKISSSRELRRHRGKKPADDADLRGRDGPADEDFALGTDLRARLGGGGGGCGGSAPEFCLGAEGDDGLEAENLQAESRGA